MGALLSYAGAPAIDSSISTDSHPSNLHTMHTDYAQ
jgi:hypothetical protein